MKDKGFRIFSQGFAPSGLTFDKIARMWKNSGITPDGKKRKGGKRVVTRSPSGSYTLWYKK